MQPSEAPRKEIGRAREAVIAMRTSQSLVDFDEHWKQFLHRIERVWNKIQAHFGRSPKWGNWVARFEKERRQDPLLSYLCNARGAEEHTTAEVTGREPAGVGIALADGVGVQPDGSVHIEDLTISTTAGRIEVQSAQPLKITFHPERVRMEPVTNRGRLYPMPTAHLGSHIDPNDLPAVAELALKYYESVLSQAEAFFVR
ncbi:MAG: hypothetical protein ACHP83_01290 [Burkholderiales bacterium]